MSNQITKSDKEYYLLPNEIATFNQLQSEIDALQTDYETLTLNSFFSAETGGATANVPVILKRVGNRVTINIAPLQYEVTQNTSFFRYNINLPIEWRPPQNVSQLVRITNGTPAVSFVSIFSVIGSLTIYGGLDLITNFTVGSDRGWSEDINITYLI